MGWIGLGILAGCINTVVAGIASFTHDLWTVVIDKRVGKISRVMTYGTVTACILMDRRIRCRTGTFHTNVHKIAVVARDTVTGDTRMIKIRGFESGHCVTHITVLSRWYMIAWFSVETARDRAELTTVTAFATTGDACMN